jgi:hypothetical protein
MASRHLQSCSAHLCRLRTDELVPASKYWTYRSHASDMGPVSIVAAVNDAWLYPHCFIGWLRRETGYGPMDRSADMVWIVSGALFLESSGPAQLCWWLREELLFVDHVRYVWSWSICGLSVGSVWRVGRVFPCRVYIDLNHHDFRIWVTACLWWSSRR